MNKKAYGFTIVELLIVIVIIGILAAISIVAYNGVQNQANDAAVKNDLSNFAKKIEMIRAETGEYPAGGRVLASEGAVPAGVVDRRPEGVSFKVNQAAYSKESGAGISNFIYCTGPVVVGSDMGFGIVARSKSKIIYRYSSVSGLQVDTNYGYFTNSGGWQAWATGN